MKLLGLLIILAGLLAGCSVFRDAQTGVYESLNPNAKTQKARQAVQQGQQL